MSCDRARPNFCGSPLILRRNLTTFCEATMAEGLLITRQALRKSCVLPRLPNGFCSKFRTDYRISSRVYFAVANYMGFDRLRATRQHSGLQNLWNLPSVVLAFLCTMRSWRGRSKMESNSPDRRMMRRFDMRLPAIVRLEDTAEFHTETQNVSARGVFFYLDRSVSPGTKLEVTLTFPPHVTLTDAVRVRFAARVIRVENPLPSSRIGVAAMIENYEFLRSNGSPDFLAALQKEWKENN